ncbi:hypothetical protein MPHL43072_14080 [Mycolicibacterium phlei DSM 43072]|uniref:Uncharacterized protein n=1 Tax=Mycolicibacterium phlei DSM 43239 = CCUG 21000 TaxID=1226750 RepID=A0A5N5VBV5_MYCPH|nr:hypothetical protein MPHL21000_03605 [Mycolicibacterium phlei DSM 43239 = CCUG 21000]KXW61050.1 hypothetical protein MPHL43070_06785 [Mycolicibacterium phlei DSM 43070]KXW61366.1 hypothetical protein MPHL43239_21575 [Mycolicibacterium phlei DSM 43239 = CCUG 21000]KXW72051.1 hypothetical protein MPHL43072_14080 [Mycolicibacterium phlei DSM 43072]
MSTETILRALIIALVIVALLVGFALDEKTYK